MIRWWLVRAVAWGFRRGITMEKMSAAIGRSFRHQDEDWRSDLLLDARAVNRARILRKISA